MHERHLFRSLQIDCAGGYLDSPPKIRLSGDGIPKAARKAKPLMKNLPRDRCRKSPGEDFELCQTFKFPAERISAPGERIGFYWICPNSPAMKSPSGSGRPEVYAASVCGRIATGPEAGRRVAVGGDRVDPEGIDSSSGPRCAAVAGFSLHANVCISPRDRLRLERLCRYVARPPLSMDRFRLYRWTDWRHCRMGDSDTGLRLPGAMGQLTPSSSRCSFWKNSLR